MGKCIFAGNFEGSVMYFALFVDDGLILAKNQITLKSAISLLRSQFKIPFGNARMFVGLQIERNRWKKSIFIHQNAYVKSY